MKITLSKTGLVFSGFYLFLIFLSIYEHSEEALAYLTGIPFGQLILPIFRTLSRQALLERNYALDKKIGYAMYAVEGLLNLMILYAIGAGLGKLFSELWQKQPPKANQ